MRNPLSLTYLAIAQRAKVAPALAVFVDVALREHAERQPERGNVENFDAEGCALWGGIELQQVQAIMAAMVARGLIRDGMVDMPAQTERSRHAEAQARYKARRKEADAEELKHRRALGRERSRRWRESLSSRSGVAEIERGAERV